MKKHIYSNDYETYIVFKFMDLWIVSQDDVWATKKYKTFREAKIAIDNQEIRFQGRHSVENELFNQFFS